MLGFKAQVLNADNSFATLVSTISFVIYLLVCKHIILNTHNNFSEKSANLKFSLVSCG